jgi:N-succinyldiaminopimelate aminotransferase
VPEHVQLASLAAWGDEDHVRENRRLYREKYDAVMPLLSAVLDVERPAGSFYLWPRVPGGDDEAFARGLLAARNVSVLPGSYLGRAVDGDNPGAGRVRISLVATTEDCIEAAGRIRSFIEEEG